MAFGVLRSWRFEFGIQGLEIRVESLGCRSKGFDLRSMA